MPRGARGFALGRPCWLHNEFKEHETVQKMVNVTLVDTLDVIIEIVQASKEMKNDYAKALAFILTAIGRHHKK